MTINYVTDWSVTKAVLNAMKITVIDFLYDKIFRNYNSLRKLLFNNNINFSVMSWFTIWKSSKLNIKQWFFIISAQMKR